MKQRIKLRAIIFHRSDFGDTSLIIRAFSPSHGAISIIAKGIRKSNPALATAFDLGNELDLLLYEPDAGGLFLYAENTLLRTLLPVKDPELISAAAAACELLSVMILEPTDHQPHYDLLVAYLEYLKGVTRNSLALFWRFFLRALRLQGIGFDPAVCSLCHKPAVTIAYDKRSAQPVCRHCYNPDLALERFSPEAIELLRLLPSIGNHLEEITIPVRIAAEIDTFLLEYYELHLHHRLNLKSLKVLEQFYPA